MNEVETFLQTEHSASTDPATLDAQLKESSSLQVSIFCFVTNSAPKSVRPFVLRSKLFRTSIALGRYDTQPNDMQPNDTRIMTFIQTTLSIMTLSIMTLSIMTLSIMTLSIMTLSIMTLSIIALNTVMLNAYAESRLC
jgi:hypothetical protein